MSNEEMQKEYQVFVFYYRDIPFSRIPRKFWRDGVYGLRLLNFEEYKRMM